MAVVARVVEDSIPLSGLNNGDFGSDPSSAIDVSGIVYFAADDGINGRELWRVGPSGLAEMVENAVPGGGIAAGDASSSPSDFTNFNGTLYFNVDDGAGSVTLWRVGNNGLAEIAPGSINGALDTKSGNSPSDFEVVGTSLYFVANDGASGPELWRIGTTGVAQLVEKTPGSGGIASGLSGSDPRFLTNVNGQLYFQATDGLNGFELWRVPSGGSAIMVEDSVPGGGIEPGSADSNPTSLLNFGGTLYFQTTTTAFGSSLWRTSGTNIAQVVMNSGPGINPDPSNSYPNELTGSGGTLYFQAINAATGAELWRIGTDGAAQVVQVSGSTGGINPGLDSSSPISLTDVSGKLYFQANSNGNGNELWRVNSLGFAELVDDSVLGAGIAPGVANSYPEQLTNVSGTLYFSATDGSQGVELWRVAVSGVAELVEDSVAGGGIAIGSASSLPTQLTNVNGRLFFSARNAQQGTELWRIDNAGLAIVVDNALPGDGINPSIASSNPMQLSVANGTLYFTADDGSHGVEIWKISSATTLGANQVNLVAGSFRGINRVSENSNPINLSLLNGTFYFVATDGINGTELWRLNSLGVAEIVEDSVSGGGLNSGAISSNPRDLVSVNGSVYFTADTLTGMGLWRIQSSGIAELIFESLASGGISTGLNTPRSSGLTNGNGTLYFVAADTANGNELWRLNASGSVELVEDNIVGGGINPGNGNSNPKSLMNIGDTLFFIASNLVTGEEVWRVSNAGLAEVVDESSSGDGLYPGAVESSPKGFTNFGGTLYFSANGGSALGVELWRVGTTGFAEIVEPVPLQGGINPNFSSYPSQITTAGGTLYFQANDGTRGVELWRVPSSGIPSLVELSGTGGDINPGTVSSDPRYLTNVNGTLYFQANKADVGVELWRVNNLGSVDLVEDSLPGGGIRPGNVGSGPKGLTNANGTLYFRANDGTNGDELWRVTNAGVAELIEDSIVGGGLAPGSESSNPGDVVAIGGNVFFTAEDSNRGRELFSISNGGIAVAISGENASQEILPGPIGAKPRFLTDVNGVLYFRADSGPRFGVELMRLSTNASPTVTRNNATVTGNVNTQLANSGTWNDVEGDDVLLTASSGNIVKNANGTWNWTLTPTSAFANQLVQITATDAHGDSSTVSFLASTDAKVVNRQVFYNRSTSSVFGNGTGNPTNAIDSSKSALLPGQTASFANYTNYRLGLNGMVVDVAALAAGTTIADIQFATWNGIASSGFVDLPATPVLTVIPGVGIGGSTRLKIEFADNAIRNTWLRVTLLANGNTGLSTNDRFYFGNAVAEVNAGNPTNSTLVSVDEIDVQRVRQNISNAVSISNIYDLNKDGRVNALDFSLVRQNRGLSVLRLFTAPVNLQVASTSSSLGMAPLSVPKIESSFGGVQGAQLSTPIWQATDRFFASFG